MAYFVRVAGLVLVVGAAVAGAQTVRDASLVPRGPVTCSQGAMGEWATPAEKDLLCDYPDYAATMEYLRRVRGGAGAGED